MSFNKERKDSINTKQPITSNWKFNNRGPILETLYLGDWWKLRLRLNTIGYWIMIGWDSLGGGRGIIKRYQLCSNEQLQLDYPDFNEMSKIKNELMTKLWMHTLLSYWLNHEMGNEFIQYILPINFVSILLKDLYAHQAKLLKAQESDMNQI